MRNLRWYSLRSVILSVHGRRAVARGRRCHAIPLRARGSRMNFGRCVVVLVLGHALVEPSRSEFFQPGRQLPRLPPGSAWHDLSPFVRRGQPVVLADAVPGWPLVNASCKTSRAGGVGNVTGCDRKSRKRFKDVFSTQNICCRFFDTCFLLDSRRNG